MGVSARFLLGILLDSCWAMGWGQLQSTAGAAGNVHTNGHLLCQHSQLCHVQHAPGTQLNALVNPCCRCSVSSLRSILKTLMRGGGCPKKFTRCLLLSQSVQKERRFSDGHPVKLNIFSTVGKPLCLPVLLSLCLHTLCCLWQRCKKVSNTPKSGTLMQKQSYLFSHCSTQESLLGWLLRLRFKGCCSVVSASFSPSWMHFRGGEHQSFEQPSTPQIATLKSKGIFAEWGVISRGTETSTPWLSLFCFEYLISTLQQ